MSYVSGVFGMIRKVYMAIFEILLFIIFFPVIKKMKFSEKNNFFFLLSIDDTMELREILPPNSGRDAPPTYLARNKLPKDFNGLRLPGENAQRTVLNVFGQLNKQRYILDNLKVNKTKQNFRLISFSNIIDRCSRSKVLYGSRFSYWSITQCLWT